MELTVQSSNRAKPLPDETSWKQELEELNRSLNDSLTESEMKEYAASQLAKHDGVVNSIETEINRFRAALETQYLSQGDVKGIHQKIEGLEVELSEARRVRERSIRLNGAGITSAKEKDKKRPRWVELKKRAQVIHNATTRQKT
jgi:uncharacterized coiled-coil DUF342 family protein